MYRAVRSALGAIGSPFVMVFPMNGIFHFSQQLSRSRFTGSRWQRIGPFPQSADPDLSRSLNQFHLLLKSGIFPEQIYTGSLNPSCAPKPLLTNPIAKPRSKPKRTNSKLAKQTLDPISSLQSPLELPMAEPLNADAGILGLKVKL
jgi:hypothetical protein